MTREEVFALLKSTGLKATYRQWAPAKPPPLPYVVFFSIDSSDLIADNSNYHEVTRWCVELYSEKKDDDAEGSIKQLLKTSEIPYSRNEIGTNTSGLFMVAFYFTTY